MRNKKSITTVNLLSDSSFKHRLTAKNSTVPHTTTKPQPFMFNVFTSFWYDDTEFKGLLIDSRAATRSTDGIGQLKALQRLIDTVTLDKTTAGLANFIFGIGSASSIGTVNLDILIRALIFHIIDVNTFFFSALPI